MERQFASYFDAESFIRDEIGYTGEIDLEWFAAMVQAETVLEQYDLKDLASAMQYGLKAMPFLEWLDETYENAAEADDYSIEEANGDIAAELIRFYS